MFKILRKQLSAIRGLLNEYNQWSLLPFNNSSVHRSLTTQPIQPIEQTQPKSNFHLVTAFSGFSKDMLNTNQLPSINQRKYIVGDDSW